MRRRGLNFGLKDVAATSRTDDARAATAASTSTRLQARRRPRRPGSSRARRERHLPRFPEWTMHARRQLRTSTRLLARRRRRLDASRCLWPAADDGWRPPAWARPSAARRGVPASPRLCRSGASELATTRRRAAPGRRLRRVLRRGIRLRAATIKRRRPERRRKRRAPGDARHRGQPQATTRSPPPAPAMLSRRCQRYQVRGVPVLCLATCDRGGGRRRCRLVTLQRVAAGRQARRDGSRGPSEQAPRPADVPWSRA